MELGLRLKMFLPQAELKPGTSRSVGQRLTKLPGLLAASKTQHEI